MFRKTLTGIPVILLLLTLFSCSEDAEHMSAISDKKELENMSQTPFLLYQNVPNPFFPEASIVFETARPQHLRMRVFTDDWQEVVTVFDHHYDSGIYRIIFTAKDRDGNYLPGGEYFYTLEGGGTTLVRKMKIVK